MRLIKALVALLFIAFGVLFGALNRTAVHIDLGFVDIDGANLGTSLLAAVLLGALVAGLVLTIAVIWPLHSRLRRSQGDAGQGAP